MLEESEKIRSQLRAKIVRFDEYIGSQKERDQLYALLKRTVETGESNSALLIGPRGVGKTTLVNSVLEDLRKDTAFEENATLVQLNGLLHTDDRLALVSITKQMRLDNAVDGKVFGSFAENLSFLLGCLRAGNKSAAKTVLFVLDEFDLFCAHHNQTLLYNLFDVSQSAQAPICVLGVTARLDVIELLEKRVKSRFSHRQYFLFCGEDDDRARRVAEYLRVKSPAGKKWNDGVRRLSKDKRLTAVLRRLYEIDRTEVALKKLLLAVLSKCGEEAPSVDDFEEALGEFEKDDVVEQILDLNVLELCLLIAMKHHTEIYDGQPLNFEMVYGRYVKFANSASSVQNVQRAVVMKAFEHIQNVELLQPIQSATAKLQKEYQMFRLLVFPEQITDAVKRWPGLPTDVAQWAISSLI